MNEYKITFHLLGDWQLSKTIFAPHSFQAVEMAQKKLAMQFRIDDKMIVRVETIEVNDAIAPNDIFNPFRAL